MFKNIIMMLTENATVGFGLGEILAIVILAIAVSLLVTEIKAKRAEDLGSNIFIAVLLIAISIYNIISSKFALEAMISWIIYLVNIVVSIVYTVFFILNYLKFKKQKTSDATDEVNNQLEDETNKTINEEK